MLLLISLLCEVVESHEDARLGVDVVVDAVVVVAEARSP